MDWRVEHKLDFINCHDLAFCIQKTTLCNETFCKWSQFETDRSGFIDLASDRTLRNDKFGELPGCTVQTSKVTQAELDAAIPVLTGASLVELLDRPGQICHPPTDIIEYMTEL